MDDCNCGSLRVRSNDSGVAGMKNRQWLLVFGLTVGLLFGAAEIISVVKQAPRVCVMRRLRAGRRLTLVCARQAWDSGSALKV